jgi:hypothetical protein
MLKVAYPAIKAADPQAQVLIGGLLLDCDPRNPPPGKDCTMSKFLEGILRAGGGPYFDIVSFHAYAYYLGALGRMGNGNWDGGAWAVQTTAVREKALFLQGVLNQFGYGDKALMNTEAALLCVDATWQCFETQGMYVPRAYAEALAFGLTAQVYYDMKGEWRYSGLLEPDLTSKPVSDASQAAAGFLSAVDYVGPVMGYPAGVQGYTFEKRDRSGHLDVVWSADGSSKFVILNAGEAAYDRYGHPPPAPGWVEVNYAPVYIERP